MIPSPFGPRPTPSMSPDGPSYEMDPNNRYDGGGGGRMRGLRSLTEMPNQGIAVGEPNPSTPGGMGGGMNHPGGMFAGYTGPRPGSPEWQALRAQGQHPLMDWFRSQHPNWGGFGGHQPPQGGYNGPMPNPSWAGPQFAQASNPPHVMAPQVPSYGAAPQGFPDSMARRNPSRQI